MEYIAKNIEAEPLKAPAGNDNVIVHNGDTYKRVKVFGTDGKILPTLVTQIINNNTYDLDPEQIVPSEALYNDTPETLAGDVLKRVDKNTGNNVNYREVTTWYDGTSMTDAKVDGGLYIKKYSKYYRKIIDKDGELFLEKDTMAEFRAISSYELLLLRAGVFKGVKLNGYYNEGDTPNAIEYYISYTIEEDNGYSVIQVGDVKFFHDFKNHIHLSYAGVKADNSTTDEAIIQKIIDAKFKIVDFHAGGEVLLQNGLTLEGATDTTLNGNHCFISFAGDVDGVVFTIQGQGGSDPVSRRSNNVNINSFTSSNTVTAQTFIEARSAHHLHVSNCRTDGTKRFMHCIDCYFATVEKNFMFACGQAFHFEQSTNGFNIIGNSIYGAGIASKFNNNTTGGNISGNTFELSSGALHFGFGNSGVQISGNYFEGYGATDFYIKIDGGGYQAVAGFSITGNLFYAGAVQAIEIFGGKSISIRGNAFSTKHAVLQYCFDGIRNRDIDYGGNFWESSEAGASEIIYPGNPADGFIGQDIKTASRYLPNNNDSVANYQDDFLLYNKNKYPVFKSENKVYQSGWQISLMSKYTIKDQNETFSFNLANKAMVATVYIYSGTSNADCNVYRIIKSVNNETLIFLKTIDNSSISDLQLIVNSIDGNSLILTDSVGGRYLNVVVST